METVEASLEHVAVGCNAASNALSVPVHGLSSGSMCCNYSAAFAAQNVVCVLRCTHDKESNGVPLTISETLKHQEAAVTDSSRLTSVRLQMDAQSEPQVLAGDSEGCVFLWKKTSTGAWKVEKISDERHKLPQVAVAVVAIAETKRRRLYVAAFSDGTLVAFAEATEGGGVTLMSRLDLGVKSIMEAVEAMVMVSEDGEGEESVLVAAGGVDTKVHLFEVAGGEDTLTPLLELEGHRGWIRSLAFQQLERKEGVSVVLLASASQDQRIRLWKITARSKIDTPGSSGEVKDGYLAVGEQMTYIASFDALLLGHEDWVTSVQWTQLPTGDSVGACEPALLSSSMDNTLIVWTKPTDARGSWTPSLRVGEMGGNGLLSGGVLPARGDRLNLVSLNFGGQLERWEQQPAPSKLFQPAISVSGHCAEVTDLSWSPRGDYLVSVSLDQTARVLAPSKLSKSKSKSTTGWYEISRAQVHGYDINCACFVLGTHHDQFVSGADEKILRVFEAPDEVKQLIAQLNPSSGGDEVVADPQIRTVQHAYLPELSLTNKSAEEEEPTGASESSNGYANLKDSLSLPVGDRLGRKTLWPEQRKLYGHGNEMLCVTSSHSGDLIASACKSREERYAAVRLWNTSDWSEAQEPLEGHKSSVVQLEFSPNDQFLLSVSRDRQFCLYQRQQSSDKKFALVEHVKAHRRIIWSCSWSPDSSMFALGSRDQSFSLWSKKSGKWGRACDSVAVDAAVTAVAFSPKQHEAIAGPVYVLVVGLETGAIRFFNVSQSSENAAEVTCTQVGEVAWELSPSAAILRLAWGSATSEDEYTLAAASSDSSVRMFIIKL
ncbi:hypothetical protein PRIC2_007313 [Phytophthora ramorum]